MIYKPQIENQNFVYPNFDLSEYDINIIHVPNDNSVHGSISSVSATTVSSSSITVSYFASWLLNNAEPFESSTLGNTLVWSIHVMVPGQDYYKPWRLVEKQSATNGSSIYSASTTFTITPSMFGLGSFTTGTYYIEFRFIGANSIYPVCESLSITV